MSRLSIPHEPAAISAGSSAAGAGHTSYGAIGASSINGDGGLDASGTGASGSRGMATTHRSVYEPSSSQTQTESQSLLNKRQQSQAYSQQSQGVSRPYSVGTAKQHYQPRNHLLDFRVMRSMALYRFTIFIQLVAFGLLLPAVFVPRWLSVQTGLTQSTLGLYKFCVSVGNLPQELLLPTTRQMPPSNPVTVSLALFSGGVFANLLVFVLAICIARAGFPSGLLRGAHLFFSIVCIAGIVSSIVTFTDHFSASSGDFDYFLWIVIGVTIALFVAFLLVLRALWLFGQATRC
ncbi:hypothetical protein CAOG_01135 [Capsaspora owczarzaki ATCC 30864]|uniref:Uncharacterized protein n=1 Tax=Capsaspora owczarzaki (strain ATCC 30864) TaxID=595528 RepID=A0A0D2WJU1_CAPO3|nr:hypothetical protein CAOG_01135 [Capsaspora owczarzaki ATCC 30864]KJE89703.1 hypothetical protein CAOG_001135 [Capsaspora owczarzaki ATCC 30864]|eukprot:XP_004366006.1 hypothetical protein CAOG_01135 [Capsaspora owczarzaki ATCC 30864]